MSVISFGDIKSGDIFPFKRVAIDDTNVAKCRSTVYDCSICCPYKLTILVNVVFKCLPSFVIWACKTLVIILFSLIPFIILSSLSSTWLIYDDKSPPCLAFAISFCYYYSPIYRSCGELFPVTKEVPSTTPGNIHCRIEQRKTFVTAGEEGLGLTTNVV